MRHRALLPAFARLAFSVIATAGPAGCLQGTDDESEDAGTLGADTLGLDLVPGFTEEGIDPPTDTDPGPSNDPFAGYDCDGSSTYDDVCEYTICQIKDGWDAMVESCGQGDIPMDTCAMYFSCVAGYVDCIEDHCDQSGIDSEDVSQCGSDYVDCLGY